MAFPHTRMVTINHLSSVLKSGRSSTSATHTLVAAVCLCLASTAAAADGDVLMPTEVGELYDYLDSFDAPRLAVASQGNFDSVCFAGCNACSRLTLCATCTWLCVESCRVHCCWVWWLCGCRNDDDSGGHDSDSSGSEMLVALMEESTRFSMLELCGTLVPSQGILCTRVSAHRVCVCVCVCGVCRGGLRSGLAEHCPHRQHRITMQS
jgi:hypothetical protein